MTRWTRYDDLQAPPPRRRVPWLALVGVAVALLALGWLVWATVFFASSDAKATPPAVVPTALSPTPLKS